MTDKQIKRMATQKEFRRVFDNMNTPKDIFAECSDGIWVRFCWRNPNGKFGWDRWVKVN